MNDILEKKRREEAEKQARELKEEQEKVREYNNSLYDYSDVENLIGNNQRILIRPFKLEGVSKSGMILTPSKTHRETANGQIIAEENKYPYQQAGIIVNIADDVSDSFKEKFNLGDIVYFDIRYQFMQNEFLVNRQYDDGDDKFTICIPSTLITHKVDGKDN